MVGYMGKILINFDQQRANPVGAEKKTAVHAGMMKSCANMLYNQRSLLFVERCDRIISTIRIACAPAQERK